MMRRLRAVVSIASIVLGAAVAAAAASVLGAAVAPARASATTVMVIEDFAPMRMIPSTRAPRKAYAPLGLLMETRRTAKGGQFIEATNAEQHPFEDPAWLHYWLLPQSILAAPGQAAVSLDLIVAGGGAGGSGGAGSAGSPGGAGGPGGGKSGSASGPSGSGEPRGRRLSMQAYLTDSTALPDSGFYVTANDAEGFWGSEAKILPPDAGSDSVYFADAIPGRLAAVRSNRTYRVAVGVHGKKPIRSIRERLAVARVLAAKASCDDIPYKETEVETIHEGTRKVGADSAASVVPVGVETLAATGTAAEVQWSRIVYVADVYYEDGTAETVARRIFVWWPLCM